MQFVSPSEAGTVADREKAGIDRPDRRRPAVPAQHQAWFVDGSSGHGDWVNGPSPASALRLPRSQAWNRPVGRKAPGFRKSSPAPGAAVRTRRSRRFRGRLASPRQGVFRDHRDERSHHLRGVRRRVTEQERAQSSRARHDRRHGERGMFHRSGIRSSGAFPGVWGRSPRRGFEPVVCPATMPPGKQARRGHQGVCHFRRDGQMISVKLGRRGQQHLRG